jgi:hypothetical protein
MTPKDQISDLVSYPYVPQTYGLAYKGVPAFV